ncbi:Bro-N domain-containing protein [uncultured Clostridium sp.]|uniref:BRO-N domain-containing protein n=1 Tax=uncultured Clostridium sp. TaxID=59620 RepID=UPI0025F38B53|nr:Bro-N domain-containing protein [uncultured Clostridium sp.]
MENNKVKEFLNDMFGEVRTINKDGELWFVASDVAKALDYLKAGDMTRNLEDDEADTQSLLIRSESGVEQQRDVLLINESGLYSAVLSITKRNQARYEKAKEFKRWITKEVIPAIRQDGMYVNREEEMESVNEQQRKELMNKVDVLDKVGNLLLLGNSGFATIHQVADYYEVGVEAIKSIMKRHKVELSDNGMKCYRKSEISLMVQSEPLEIPNRGMNLFPKRVILNVGMLLTQSEVVRELRSRLLDIVHDAEEVITDNGNTIVENVVEEILDEKA